MKRLQAVSNLVSHGQLLSVSVFGKTNDSIVLPKAFPSKPYRETSHQMSFGPSEIIEKYSSCLLRNPHRCDKLDIIFREKKR